MIGGGVYEVAPGEITDATEMMLCLAESLADNGRFEPEDIMARYGDWLASHPRHVSLTVRAALISYRSGTHWDVASRRAFEILGGPTAGNGSLIRCAPVGLLYSGDAPTRHEMSHRESTLTHFDRLAGWSCAAFNDLLMAALAGELAEEVPAIAHTFDDEDKRVSAVLRDTPAAEAEEIISSSFVLDTLQTALWMVLHGADFEHAVTMAVNMGNDATAAGAVDRRARRRRVRRVRHPGALARGAHGARPRHRGRRPARHPRPRRLTGASTTSRVAPRARRRPPAASPDRFAFSPFTL